MPFLINASTRMLLPCVTNVRLQMAATVRLVLRTTLTILESLKQDRPWRDFFFFGENGQTEGPIRNRISSKKQSFCELGLSFDHISPKRSISSLDDSAALLSKKRRASDKRRVLAFALPATNEALLISLDVASYLRYSRRLRARVCGSSFETTRAVRRIR